MSGANRRYPDRLEIEPLTRPPRAAVRVPGSKSITNRALVLAAVAGEGESNLLGALRSEDTEVMIDGLRRLGFDVEADWGPTLPQVTVSNPARTTLAASADLFVGNSG